ncbi:hypothetical protein SAMN05443253_102550 [Bacillus sp. OK048]|nr:hypothetical protein SAMN05443253_102550 [Bacillus sp. OK048]
MMVMMTKTAVKTPGKSHHDGDDDQNSGENAMKESS